ncbi:Hypothetical predicted protein [Olea europaea subsp. europaea]|uniref:Uncharacterized protein n=1 Tax=Olea europaea subsp. europaea TaxID=158383 RepID=A0A8S0QDN8_OLEEU|nr:Hypothetical predicted protein [Olea europaea subsp. europaea]
MPKAAEVLSNPLQEIGVRCVPKAVAELSDRSQEVGVGSVMKAGVEVSNLLQKDGVKVFPIIPFEQENRTTGAFKGMHDCNCNPNPYLCF